MIRAVSWSLVTALCCTSSLACLISRGTPKCQEGLDCEACVERTGCGYCNSETGICVPGTSLGPDDVTVCDHSSWHFSSCPERIEPVNDADIPADCPRYGSCVDCVADLECGYCLEGVECRHRDRPAGCELVVSSDDCGGRSWCDDIDSCIECVQLDGCAYCPESEQCVRSDRPEGCELLRRIDDGRCDPSVCRDAIECEDCTAILGCGYCPSTKYCNSTSYTFGCEQVEEPMECPLEECEDAEQCDVCLGFGCHWCDMGGGFCHGIYDDSCPIFYEFPTEGTSDLCPPTNRCSQHLSCRDCLTDFDCGWCTHPTLTESGDGLCLASFSDMHDLGMRCSGYFTALECL